MRFSPRKAAIALLEIFDDAQRVQIVIEEQSRATHCLIERLFAGVSKRRMADVVHERQRFNQIGVQVQLLGDGARDLRNLERVREAIAEVIGEASGEYLRLVFQTAESARMYDAVAVTLVVVAIGMRRFRIAASA